MIKQKFTILGPSGVGKTSLMATMYDNVREMFNGTLLSIRPSSNSNQRINRAVAEMNAALTPNVEFEPVLGTSEAIEYSFSVGMNGNYYIECAFKDFPGGWLSDDIDKFENEIQPWLNESQILVLPVDASLVMQYNKKDKKQREAVINFCEIPQLERIIGDWAKIRKANYSFARIFVVPLRCETYINDYNKSQLMYSQISDIYEPVFKSLNNNMDSFDIYYCPVDTYGCVKFLKCKWEKNAIGGLSYRPTFVCDSTDNPKRIPRGADEIFAYMLGIFAGIQYNDTLNQYSTIKNENDWTLFFADLLPSWVAPDSWKKIQRERDALLEELKAFGTNGQNFLLEIVKLLDNRTVKRLKRLQI